VKKRGERPGSGQPNYKARWDRKGGSSENKTDHLGAKTFRWN